MYKIGVIGERDSVLGFKALGFSVFEASEREEALSKLKTVAKDPEYAIIFVTERVYSELNDEISKYKDSPTPAIICIPGREGSQGYGMANIKNAMERAVGADILFKE